VHHASTPSHLHTHPVAAAASSPLPGAACLRHCCLQVAAAAPAEGAAASCKQQRQEPFEDAGRVQCHPSEAGLQHWSAPHICCCWGWRTHPSDVLRVVRNLSSPPPSPTCAKLGMCSCAHPGCLQAVNVATPAARLLLWTQHPSGEPLPTPSRSMCGPTTAQHGHPYALRPVHAMQQAAGAKGSSCWASITC
jgi:hypothetical protein